MNTPNTTNHTTPHITDLRAHLLQTLAALRDRENPMEPDRARAVAQVGGVLVDTARVEIDYLKATGQDHSAFLSPPGAGGVLPRLTTAEPSAHNPFPSTVHRLQG